jgi:hypothetical protein
METTPEQQERRASAYDEFSTEHLVEVSAEGWLYLGLAEHSITEEIERRTEKTFDLSVRALRVATAIGCQPATQAVLEDRADDSLMTWLAAREASRQVFKVRACEGGYDVVDTRTGDQVVEPMASKAVATEYASMFEAILSAYVTGGAR